MKNLNEKKGITLIALVITIIILIILAGVTIATLKNNNLYNHAKNAKAKYEDSESNELNRLDEYSKAIDGQSNEKIKAEDVSFTPADPNWKVKNVKEALDYLYNN